MPICVVWGCKNRPSGNKHLTEGLKLKFFVLPRIRLNQGEETKQLCLKRRRLWKAAVNRNDIMTEEAWNKTMICSRHFVGGEKAYLHFHNSPSWLPTLHLGYDAYSVTRDSEGSASTSSGIVTRSRLTNVCCVANCRLKGRKVPLFERKTCFAFPREETRCKEWLRNCALDELSGKSPIQLRSEGHKICSDHFEANQFHPSGQIKRLASDAVPTIYRKKWKIKPGSSRKHQQAKVPKLLKTGAGHADSERELSNVELEIDYAEDPTYPWVSSESNLNLGEHGYADSGTHALSTYVVPDIDIKTEPVFFEEETFASKHVKDMRTCFSKSPMEIKTESTFFEEEISASSNVMDIPTCFIEMPVEIKTEPVFFEEEMSASSNVMDMRTYSSQMTDTVTHTSQRPAT